MRKIIWKLALVLVGVGILIFSSIKLREKKYYVTQYGDDQMRQAMFYTITDSTGGLIIIDGGIPEYEEKVRTVISEHNNHVDAWILTHSHSDHIGAFNEIYSNLGDITIGKIYTNGMDGEFFSKVYSVEHDHYEYWLRFEELTKDADNIYPLHKSEELEINGLKFQVMNAYTKDFENYTFEYDLPNASSLVFKVTNNDESMLFLADCEESMEQYMGEYDRHADYVQVAHHGQNMSDEWYEKIGAEAAFVDAPKWLRTGEQYTTKNRLSWFAERNIKVFSFDTVPNVIRLK